MSSSYKLLYQDRRQFVFEEFQETHSTAILTLVAGFIAGSLVGIYFASLDATTAGSILLAVVSYITFITSTFSLKTSPISVLLIFVTSLSAVLLLIYMSRVVLGYFSDSPMKLILVYAAFFAIFAELVYLWSRITWVEDSRMHQLIDAERDDRRTRPPHYPKDINLLSFSRFVAQVIWFGFLRLFYYLKGDKETAIKYPFLFVESLSKWPLANKQNPITVKNESLKRVKVCVYHRSDYCCWIPVGGLTGGVYDLERGEELVFSPHWPDTSFRVKIFAHGVIDFELASNPCVVRGHRYSFIDVGKPITLLSVASPPPSGRVSVSFSDNDDSEDDQEDPDVNIVRKTSFSSSRPNSRIGLRRVASSRANLSALAESPNSPRSVSDHNNSHETLLTPTSTRKSFKLVVLASQRDLSTCVAILNDSTTDVKLSFYNIEDTSFVIALDELKVVETSMTDERESNMIRRNTWKIFEYIGTKPKTRFCMRVRTALAQTAANVELSFCTALLGDALVVRDPIVSPS
jgi:hypothetical protein